MCAALIGGMDRLKPNYVSEAKRKGVKLKVFTGKENRIADKLGRVDALIVFTGKVSHSARNEVVKHAKSRAIPVHMHHSCGVSTLRKCLNDVNFED